MNYIFKTILFKNYSFPCVFNLRHVFILHNVRFQKITEYKLKIQVDTCFDHIHTTSFLSSPCIHTILLLFFIPLYSHHTPPSHHPPIFTPHCFSSCPHYSHSIPNLIPTFISCIWFHVSIENLNTQIRENVRYLFFLV